MYGAGLADRITIREQNVTSLDDTDAYECAWFPTFLVTEAVFEAAMPRLPRAVRARRLAGPRAHDAATGPAGLGGHRAAHHPGRWRRVRRKRLVAALEPGGCTGVRVLPRRGPVPLEYVIGK